MPRFDRRCILLSKIQPTSGVDAVPTGAANAVLLAGPPKCRPLVANNVDRELIRDYYGASEQLVGTSYVEIEFSTEYQSSGVGGTAPPWGVLARGSGHAEVIQAAAVTGTAQAGSTSSTIKLAAGASASNDTYNGMRIGITSGTGSGQSALVLDYDGTSKVASIGPSWTVTPDATSVYSIDANVAYNPISTAQEMLSHYYYRDGVQRKLLDSRGKFDGLGLTVGGRPLFKWRFLGVDGGVVASPNPAQTLSGWKVPAMITDANTGDLLIDGVAYPSRGLTLNNGNEVAHTPLLGAETVDIPGRVATGRLELDLTAAQVASFHAATKANTLHTVGLLHGTAAGSRMGFHGAAVQFTEPEETSLNGRALDAFNTRYTPVLGNDEYRLVAM